MSSVSTRSFDSSDVSADDVSTLVLRATKGDEVAWAEIVRRFERVIWFVTRNHGLNQCDATDVCQTVWLRFAQNLERIRDPERVGLWLHTTTRNECLKMLKIRVRLNPIGSGEAFEDLPMDRVSYDDRLERTERDVALRAAFRSLPEKCRSLLNMLLADPPMSYRDISDSTGLAVGSIGSRRQRCLSDLRKCVESDTAVVG
jgi:RNA polymerase sigma factor (sigma-70 family)